MKRPDPRRSDSGTIAVITAIMLPILFGMAALAIDAGFLYTRSRMIHAVADSAVAVGMKDLMAGASSTTITTDVNDIAGKYGATYSITAAPSANQVQVTVTATYPLFFGSAIGFPSKRLTVVAIGVRGSSPPPILALGSTCGSGVTINGQGVLKVDGNLESNASVIMGTGPTGPDILGDVTAKCGPVTLGPGAVATGTVGTGGPFPDPFSPYVLPACTQGSTASSALSFLNGYYDNSTTPPTLPAGVYCSSGNLLLTDPGGGFNATGVTFISIGGTISIQVNKASTITPNPASPNGIIAYSTANTGTFPGDIAITGPAGTTFDMLGSFYAPNGTVNIQQNGPYKMGSIIANNVWIGDNNDWEIGVGSGGGGTGWQMSQ